MLGSSVKIASEKKMRAEANSLIGIDNLKCQLVPFTFPVKDGRHTVEIKNVPMCYTPHLWEKIQHILNSNDDDERRYNLINQLRDCANILFFLECTGLLGMKGRYLLTRSGSSWVEIREEGVLRWYFRYVM